MFEHDVQPERKVVVVRAREGDAPSDSSPAELAAGSVGRLLEDPAIEPDFSIMIVVSPAAETPEPREISRIAELQRLLQKKFDGRIAVVVSGVGHATPAQIISSLSGSSIEVFQDEAAALRWILEGRMA